jgi:hypothetical protein
VPPARWAASSRKLFARNRTPDDVAAVAADVGAKIVVTGAVKRDGRAWQLLVTVRDGNTGKSRDKLKYPLKGPRLTPRTLAQLASDVSSSFDRAITAAQADEEELAPVNPKQPPLPAERLPPTENPPVAKGKGKKPTRVAKGDEESIAPPPATPPPTDDETPPGQKPPPPKQPVATVVTPAPAGRPRWAPYFDVSAGGSISGRAFDFAPTSLPRFSSSVVGGLHIDLTIYPMASLWRMAGGVLAGLGVGATLDKPFWPDSHAVADPMHIGYATSELRVVGGLRWRFVLYKPIPRPELVLSVGGGLHSFSIAKIDMGGGALTDVGPPDVAYKFVALGAIVRLHFAEWARIWAAFHYQVVTDAGSITTDAEYGAASVFGVRVDGGLDFFVWRGLKLGGVGFYQRFAASFNGAPGMRGVANGAVDQYWGGVLAVGYEL